MTKPKPTKPTTDTAAAFQHAYDVFNRKLYKGELPQCMITLRTFGKARGYFSPDRFIDITTVSTTHEIALDPRQFVDRTAVEILSTLAHEMAHLWQQVHGSPSRNGYHNTEWGDKMKAIGLHPSDTGAPGGKETGQRMTHYIMEDGRFLKVATELVASGKFQATWADVVGLFMVEPDKVDPKLVAAVPTRARKVSTAGQRTKYICPACANATWGRAGLKLWCLGDEAAEHDPAPME